MTTLQEHRLSLAKGRRLVRLGMWMLGITFAYLVLGMATALLAVQVGWMADDDARPAVIGIVPLVLGLISFAVLAFLGRRLIWRSIEHVAANPEHELPETLRVGPAVHWLQTAILTVIITAATVFLVFFASLAQWLLPALTMLVFAALLFWMGPAAAGIDSAYFDPSGIHLPQLGVQVPWTSITRLDIKETGVHIGIDGPVEPTGRLADVWTQRALRRLQRDQGLDLTTNRQDAVMWVARRYLTQS